MEKKWSDVDDVVEATDAVWARRADNSRVSRLTLNLESVECHN